MLPHADTRRLAQASTLTLYQQHKVLATGGKSTQCFLAVQMSTNIGSIWRHMKDLETIQNVLAYFEQGLFSISLQIQTAFPGPAE